MAKKRTDIIKSVASVLVIILLWELVCRAGVFSQYVFPSPERVWNAFWSMVKTGELWKHLIDSFVRVAVGFLLSAVLGMGCAFAAAAFPGAKPFYKPLLDFLRHVPPMSLIPLLILWFGIGQVPKITVIVLTSFFPIFMNTEAGIENCDEKLVEVGKTLGMEKSGIFFKIRVPFAFPDILVGMKIAMGYSWRAIVGAEMIAAVSGIGYMILDAQAMSRTDKMLVGIILIGIFGMITDALFSVAVKKVSKRMGHVGDKNG